MWTPEQIEGMLNTNDQAIARALLALWARQTDEEQQAQETIVKNGRGFASGDAKRAAFHVEYINKWGASTPYFKSKILPHWQEQVRGKMRICKYARQLAEIANMRKNP
jgi:hypothetical protein